MPNWKKVLLNGNAGSLSTLSLTGLSAQNSETDVLTINGSNVVGTRQLGSNAFTSTTIGTTTNNLTVDNTTIQLNSGTTFNGSAARTISAKTAAITEAGDGLATSAQIYTFVTGLGYGEGTVTSVGTNTGLSGTVTTSGNLSLALADLADMTQEWDNTSDEFIVLDSGTQKRKLSSEIFGSNAFTSTTIPTNNNQLTNGAGYTTNTGTVDTSGTPADNQVAVFTDSNTIEGTSGFTYDSSTKELLLGESSAGSSESNTLRIQGYNSGNPALLKLGWNNWGGTAFESGFSGTANLYTYGTNATAGGRLVLGQSGDTGTNQQNYLWIRGDNKDDAVHIYMGANSTTYSSEIGIERIEGTGVNYESDIALRANAGTSGHKSEYIFSRKGLFLAKDSGFAVSGSGQVFIGGFSGSIDQTTDITGYDQSLAVSGSAIIESSGSNIFKVEGSVGPLFTVDDGLDDVIFSANNISGTPVIEANADNTVKLGKLNGFGIVISGSTPAPSDDSANIIITGSIQHRGSYGLNVAASSTLGRFDASNDVVAFSTSDERLKENVTPIENALDKVSQIQGVEFDWKPLSDEEKRSIHGNEGHDVGVIAQEVEKILPEVVQERDNGYKAVKYEKIIPLLVEAIKELQAEVQELKNSK